METTKQSKLKWNTWQMIAWKQVDLQVFKLQKRIYRATQKNELPKVRKLQKMMTSSMFAKLVAVRKVTQENKGKKTAGIDGVKSLNPKERLTLAQNLKLNGNSSSTRRIWIPKSNAEKRPLSIPTIQERAKQTLLKLALEPEWEARFEPHSYGFRPGRSPHDAIKAIFCCINKKPKYVLDADISKCFDKINHQYLLDKLNTSPTFSRQIKAWLKAGVIDFSERAERKGHNPTHSGTPQGGSISPLLANIALHGMEKLISEHYPSDTDRRLKHSRRDYGRRIQAPRLIRYADDFVILCEELALIEHCKHLVENWLKDADLELHPDKTRIVHTLKEHNEQKPGFNFLGFEVRQFKVGKHQSGSLNGKKLGFKTIIQPSKESIDRHYQTLKATCIKHRALSAGALISNINPIIRGWCNYQSPWHASKSFSKVKDLLWKRLWRWAKRRHPKKKLSWIKKKYFGTKQRRWAFVHRTKEADYRLLYHSDFPKSVKWIQVKEGKSPFDGDELYWSRRIGDKYKTYDPQKSRLLKIQKGKCKHCGLGFKPDDIIEKHHLKSKVKGGNNADNNLILVHLYCHDQIHT